MTQPLRRIAATRGVFAAVVAGALALTASACSTGHTATPPAASPTASVTAAAVDSAELTREQGAEKYLEIIGALNDSMDKCMPVLNGVLDDGDSSLSALRKIRTACADMPKTNRQFADDLSSITWPAEARDGVGQLVDELRADQLAWQEIADARTEDDIFDPTYPLTEDGNGADLVRAHLGLPGREDVEEEEE
ncbi:MAG: hypothetical protein ACRDQ0_04060 [Pseudonocardia sp.]